MFPGYAIFLLEMFLFKISHTQFRENVPMHKYVKVPRLFSPFFCLEGDIGINFIKSIFQVKYKILP